MKKFNLLPLLILVCILVLGLPLPHAFADGSEAQSYSGSKASTSVGDIGGGSIGNVEGAKIGDIGSGNVYEASDSEINGVTAPVGDMVYPGMPGRFDAPPDSNKKGEGSYMRIPVQVILQYDDAGLTTAEAMKMSKSSGRRVLVRAKYGKVDEKNRLPKDTTMPVVFKKQQGMRSLGIIVIVSDSKKAISADVFADVQVKAWELGGQAMHIIAEGFQREVHTSGKGIGFSWTGTTVSGASTTTNTGVLGFGASWGQAGYYDHPFIMVHVLAAK